MKKKKIIIPVILAAVAVIAAVAAYLFFFRTTDESAYVQTVAMIMGQEGGGLLSDRYTGIVEAKNIVKIKLDDDKKVDQCFVEVGDTVIPGTPLFSYDVDSLELTYSQVKIDYETKLNNIQTYGDEVQSLEKQLKRARARAKAELNVQLSTAQLNLKKETYEAEQKKKVMDELAAIMEDNVVRAVSGGTVRSINPPSDVPQDNQQDSSYMTIVAENDYWVMGKVSEQTAYSLIVGSPVVIRSRTDRNRTWTGTIAKVNTEEPVSNGNGGYYVADGSDSASKYAFYVELDSTDGLMMGQHLHIELGNGENASRPSFTLVLPSYYLMDEGGSFHVYAKNAKGRIEKRKVEVGNYDEETDTYEVISGLSVADSIAVPDETVKPGMIAKDAGYAEEDTAQNMEFGEDVG